MEEYYIWDNGSMWHKGWPHWTDVGQWLDFVSYLEDYLMDEGHTCRWYNGSVWYKDWPHKIYVGKWSIFCVSDFTKYFEGYWWINIIFGLMDQCDTKISLIKYMQINDLYFVVQWFCLISWLSTINYFEKFNNGASRGYLCTAGHLL